MARRQVEGKSAEELNDSVEFYRDIVTGKFKDIYIYIYIYIDINGLMILRFLIFC